MAIIHIKTAQQLQDMNLDTTADYILDNDIDLTGVKWLPIGYGNQQRADKGTDGRFTGTFDGQGFTISNLNCDDDYNQGLGYTADVVGLFGYVGNDISPRQGVAVSKKNGTIKNLKLIDVTLTGNYALGAVVGFIIGADITNIQIVNVIAHATDEGEPVFKNASAIGGLGGDCYNVDRNRNISSTPDYLITTLTNCSVDGFTVSIAGGGELDYVGGLTGSAYGYTTKTFVIENCSAKNISIVSEYNPYSIGGFIGYCDAATIHKCYAQGIIYLPLGNFGDDTFNTPQFIGGFIGDFRGSVKDCYTDTDIDIDMSADENDIVSIGGFIGEAYSTTKGPTTIRNCYCEGDVTVRVLAGAFIGNTFNTGSTISANPIGDGLAQVQFPTGTTVLTYMFARGGGGAGGVNTEGEGGGGGGAHSFTTAGLPVIIPGVNYSVSQGVAGIPGVDGGDSWAFAASTIFAKGGQAGQGRTGGTGGQASAGIGGTKHSGGNGATSTGASAGGGEGGGAATSAANGDNGNTNAGGSGGSGGFGGDGGNNAANGTEGSASAGGGGGGANGGTAAKGGSGAVGFDYSHFSYSSVGGFIGDVNSYFLSNDIIENCFSVSTVLAPVNSSPGGFIGHIKYSNVSILNCAWWIGAFTHAIGNYLTNSNISLGTLSFGTDEPNNRTLWHKEHPVYAQ